jgi:hypothetical protein
LEISHSVRKRRKVGGEGCSPRETHVVAQMVQCLASKCEAMNSNLSSMRERETETERDRETDVTATNLTYRLTKG